MNQPAGWYGSVVPRGHGGAAGNIQETYRIDSMQRDPADKSGELMLYRFSVRDPESGEWENFCAPDLRGNRWGFPMTGYWDDQGRHIHSKKTYSITCTGGGIAKCVRAGYFPWKTTATGLSLWEHHQTCTRMMRADYCGNGTPHTRDGTRIEVIDAVGMQEDSKTDGLVFEASWAPDGAVCMKKTRIPEEATLTDTFRECPRKLNLIKSNSCQPERLDPPALILNRS